MFLQALFHARRDRFFTIYATPRFTRELWERFRAAVAANDETIIDVLRALVERYIAEGRPAAKR